MKAKTSIFASFVVGAILASLPYTLSRANVNAQDSNSNLVFDKSSSSVNMLQDAQHVNIVKGKACLS